VSDITNFPVLAGPDFRLKLIRQPE